MSKILRRPMFRGGGKVSSYGNGIATGLADGGNINTPGGIVDLPGGYNDTPMERFLEQFGNVSVGTSGGTIPKSARKNFKVGQDLLDDNNVGFETENQSAESLAGKIDEVETEKNSFEEMISNNQYGNQDSSVIESSTIEDKIKSETPSAAESGSIADIINKQMIEVAKKSDNTFIDGDGQKRDKTSGEIIVSEGRDLDYQDNLMQENYDTAEEAAKKISTLNLNGNNDNTEESTVLSTKDAIAENQKLFKELLGADKAKGRDIADMLLSASSSLLSKGDVREGFAEFAANQAKSGPSRTEKINQTAAGLAINDFVAGKRSKEQAEIYKGKVDYEYKQKAALLNVQPGDSAQTALFKIAKKGDVKPTSDAAYKYLIEMKTGSDKTFRIDKVKMKDLEKPKSQKKLKIGFNIIEEDGRKNIVQWDGKNYNILSISELWKG